MKVVMNTTLYRDDGNGVEGVDGIYERV